MGTSYRIERAALIRTAYVTCTVPSGCGRSTGRVRMSRVSVSHLADSSPALAPGSANEQRAGPAAAQVRKNARSVSDAPSALFSRVVIGSSAPVTPYPVDQATGSTTPSITTARTRLGNIAAYVDPTWLPYE